MRSVLTQDETTTQARSAIENSPIFALRELSVERSGDRLLISGRVKTFYHKQLAQEAVRKFANGLRVVNNVAVVD